MEAHAGNYRRRPVVKEFFAKRKFGWYLMPDNEAKTGHEAERLGKLNASKENPTLRGNIWLATFKFTRLPGSRDVDRL